MAFIRRWSRCRCKTRRYARCRNLTVDEYIKRVEAGERYIVRFRSSGSHLKKMSFVDEIRGKIEMAQNDLDLVIIKADGLPTYHFAHVVDDHFMRTNLVTRGEEWLPSVPVHVELFNAMGFEIPKFAHFSSIMVRDGESKRKLSKRKKLIDKIKTNKLKENKKVKKKSK